MKRQSKIVFVLSILFLVLSMTALGQNKEYDPAKDDEFNIFLLSLATIFVCAMIGAAIVGAFAAAITLFFLFALIAVGVLSTSVAIGLYRRSFSAGFKSFLMILFGIGCSFVGALGLLLADKFFDLPLSSSSSLLVGLLGGLIGGLVLAIASWNVIRWVIKLLTKKLNPA
jgi:hypothetical protein